MAHIAEVVSIYRRPSIVLPVQGVHPLGARQLRGAEAIQRPRSSCPLLSSPNPMTASLVKSIVRLAYPYNRVRRVLRGPTRGLRFELQPGMGASYALGADCWHHRFLSQEVKEGMVVYDVGGNWGQMALFFAAAVGKAGKVFTFEPAPGNIAQLKKNLALNHLDQVEVIDMALGTQVGRRTFVYDAERPAFGSFDTVETKMSGVQSFEVSCETIDHLIANGMPKPAIIKIDVEGGGEEVIEGGWQTLSAVQPRIYFEMHAANDAAPEYRALCRLRDGLGYSIRNLSVPGKQLAAAWGEAFWCEPRS